MDAPGFAQWVRSVEWRFAKSMPDVPHEYTVRAWGDPLRFDEAARFIRTRGYKARWRDQRPKHYYDLGDCLYWAFRFVINRARLDDPVSGVVERV